MTLKIQVRLRNFEGEYHYPAGLLNDAADYIDALEREVERLRQLPLPYNQDVSGVEIPRGGY